MTTICKRRDSTVLEEWDLESRIYTRYRNDQLETERVFTDAENVWADSLLMEAVERGNQSELLRRARKAYQDNRTYLQLVADGLATQADHIAQIVRLTRQNQALLPLVVTELLGDIDPPE